MASLAKIPACTWRDSPRLLRFAIACFPVNPGFADYLLGLTEALREHGDVAVLTSTTLDPVHQAALGPATYCFRRSRHLPIDIWSYVAHVLATRPDVLLVQAWLKWPLLECPLIWLFRLAGIRCVATVHDVLPHEPKPWDRLFLRWYYRAFDGLVAHSRQARDQLGAMGVRRPIALIQHALLDRFNREPLARMAARDRVAGLQGDEASFVALFFGHLTRRKGALAFAEAARHLEGQGVKLLMAGEPDLLPRELAQLRAACASGGVLLREGHVPFGEVQALFASADCVVIPYLEGTTSGVLKVAIAFEKPVVATPIGDVTETVDDRSAVLIPVTNLPAGIAAGILEARARAPELATEIAKRKENLSWEHIGAAYAMFLRSMLGTGLPQPTYGAGPAGAADNGIGPL